MNQGIRDGTKLMNKNELQTLVHVAIDSIFLTTVSDFNSGAAKRK